MQIWHIGTTKGSRTRNAAVGLIAFATFAVASCASTGDSSSATTPPAGATSSPTGSIPDAAVDRADSLRHSYTEADAAFMRGMIHHHAQALVMSEMVPTHGASRSIQTLASRIINGQKGEITLMRAWLHDHGEPAPEVAPDGTIAGGHHGTHRMPGMLTDKQMAELDAARGYEFDLLFLTYMVRHHQGAITMVENLLASQGAAQNETVFKLASDIGADQASEIDRMQAMLRAMMFDSTETR